MVSCSLLKVTFDCLLPWYFSTLYKIQYCYFYFAFLIVHHCSMNFISIMNICRKAVKLRDGVSGFWIFLCPWQVLIGRQASINDTVLILIFFICYELLECNARHLCKYVFRRGPRTLLVASLQTWLRSGVCPVSGDENWSVR